MYACRAQLAIHNTWTLHRGQHCRWDEIAIMSSTPVEFKGQFVVQPICCELKECKGKGKGKGVCIAIYGNPSHNYGVSLAVWDHTVLPSTRLKRTHPAFTPARQAGTRFTDHLRMEGWVSPGPGCKKQLAHGCYMTAWASKTRTHDLSIASRSR